MKKLLISALLMLLVGQGRAIAAEHRVALVIGNANYQTGALPTPANDAGLVAQTLQAAGFDVTGARDLDQESLRRAFHDFLDKVTSSGSDTVAYIYLSGYGLQLEGENYFVPIDARIPSDANVSSEALRLSDYLKPLAALHLKASIVVLDIARANPYAKNGTPLSSGLALVEPEPNTLIAFNAAPGTVAPNEAGPYSAYAEALAEISREGGVPIDEVFTRVRLRVNELTKGAEVPWQSSKLESPFYLFERAPDAPPPAVSSDQTSSIRTKPIREFDASDAYLAALDRDTLQAYLDFVAAFPNDPMVPRVRAIIAARREAIIWRRTRSIDTPRAYWSYLRRYPRGAHSYDARRRLRELAAAFEPPPSFEVVEYDVPPPLPDEMVYVERPVLVFDDPDFDFVPPPPPPVIFLPPPPVYFIDLPPPPPPVIAFVLPIPEYRPIPVWVVPPARIAPPPTNIIYNNIHNTVVINNTTNTVTITNPRGHSQTVSPAVAATAPLGGGAPAPSSPTAPPKPGITAAGVAAVAAIAPSLPKSLSQKAAMTPSPPPAPPAKPLAPGRVLRLQSTAPAIPNSSQTPASRVQPRPTAPNRTAPANRAATAPGSTPARQQSGKPQLGQPLPGAAGGQPLPPAASGKTAPNKRRSGTPATQHTPGAQPGAPGTVTTHPATPGLQAPHSITAPTKPSIPTATKPNPPLPTSGRSTITPRSERHRPAPPPPGRHTAPPAPTVHGPTATRPVSRQPTRPVAPPPHIRPAAPSRLAPPPPAVVRHAPPRAARPAPPLAARPVPAPARTAPPPAAVRRANPPPMVRSAPPPQMARPAAPSPQARPVAPKPFAPPPAMARPAPPPVRAPAPAAGKPAQRGCVLPSGQPCPAR